MLMGLFGDLFMAVASEIGNSFLEGLNDTNEQKEIENPEIERLKETYYRTSLEDLKSFMEDCSDIEKVAFESIINERNILINYIRNNYQDFLMSASEIPVESLVELYKKVQADADSLYGEGKGDIIFNAYKDVLMRSPRAKAIYKTDLDNEFKDLSYDDLIKISNSKDIHDDELRKAAADEELCSRDADIYTVLNELDEISNDEFMEIYDRVRKDKGYVLNSETSINYKEDEVEFYWRHYGEKREDMLACFEDEIEDRQYLLNDFINDYCEDEVEEYLNKSTKELKNIVCQANDMDDDEYTYDTFSGEIFECDKITKVIISAILTNRGC